MTLFAIEYTYAPEYAELRDEHRPEHREWLAGLLELGINKTSGPFADGSGALLVFEAESGDHLSDILADDPFARAGAIGAVTVREWVSVFGPFS